MMVRVALVALALSAPALAVAGSMDRLMPAAGAATGSAPGGCAPAIPGADGPARGAWVVVTEPRLAGGDAAAGGLAVTTFERWGDDRVGTDPAPLLCLLDRVAPARDIDASLAFVPGVDPAARGAGLAFRVDDRGYLVARVAARTGQVALERFSASGTESVSAPLAVATVPIEAEAAQLLRVRAVGERIEVFVNRRRLLAVTLKEPSRSGRVALWTRDGAPARFGLVEVRRLE